MTGLEERFRVVDGTDFLRQVAAARQYLIDTAGDPPPIPWFVPAWIPDREPTLLAGAGGGGKSLLALQLQAATALGRPWLGLDVPQCASLGLYSEDGAEVTATRLDAIARHYGVDDVRELLAGGLAALPKPEGDVALVSLEGRGGRLMTTAVFEDLRRTLDRLGPRLLILDNLADFLPVIAFDNAAIRTARRIVLDTLCRDYGLTIVGLQNVTLQGLRGDGEARGGSGGLAWRDAFRSRLHVARPTRSDDEDDEAGCDSRTLERVKANYAGTDSVAIRWQAGVFVRDGQVAGGDFVDYLDSRARERWLQDAVIDLVRGGREYSTAYNSPHYVPRLLASREDRPRGFGARSVKDTYQTLTARDVIRVRERHDGRRGRVIARIVAVGETQL